MSIYTLSTHSFYTYLYFDTRPEKHLEPIYAGKGKNKRSHLHLKGRTNSILAAKIEKMKSLGLEPLIKIYKTNSEDEALSLEMWFIHKYGRIDLGTGSLCNLTDGGDGGSSGHKWTEEQKSKKKKVNAKPEVIANKSAAQKAANNKPEVIAKRCAAQKIAQNRPEVKAKLAIHKIGKKHSQETIARMSKPKSDTSKMQGTPEKSAKTAALNAAKRRLKHPEWTEMQHLDHDKFLKNKKEKTILKKKQLLD